MDLLVLQGLHERFAARIVPRITFAGHADHDAARLQQIRILTAGVLGAAIGVMDQACIDCPTRQRHP